MMTVSQSSLVEGEEIPFTILADSECRQALHILADAESPMAFADLAAEITTRERGNSDREFEWDQVKRTYVSLYHNHVPRLEEFDLVTFNRSRRTVALADSVSSTEIPQRGI